MGDPRVQDRADLPERVVQLRVRPTVDGGGSRRRPVEAEDHAHGRRLPGAVGSEETGDRARSYDEIQVVDGDFPAEYLGEADCLDHGASLGVGYLDGVGVGDVIDVEGRQVADRVIPRRL
ncbi:hypothetical protein GCM10022243_11600 [Saccharothrix violaceirubra]